jgi:hypothetical protein
MLFVRFVEMFRSPKGSDMMFLNNQEGKEDSASMLTTYKTNIQSASQETDNFS